MKKAWPWGRLAVTSVCFPFLVWEQGGLARQTREDSVQVHVYSQTTVSYHSVSAVKVVLTPSHDAV